MMPVVRISDATMQKLKPLAIPLEDSIDSLLDRLADAARNGVPFELPGSSKVTEAPQPSLLILWDVKKHEDLTHTRLISAEFGGETLPRYTWNALVKYAHETAGQKLGSFDALRRATRGRVKQGKYEQEGFVYLPEIDVSLQGMDANMAWDNSVRLAHAIGVSVSVMFEWRNNPNAAKPGEKSQLVFNPK